MCQSLRSVFCFIVGLCARVLYPLILLLAVDFFHSRQLPHTYLRTHVPSVAGSVFVPTESPHIASMWETPGSGVPEPCKKLYKNKKDFDLRICSRAFQVVAFVMCESEVSGLLVLVCMPTLVTLTLVVPTQGAV